MIIGKSIKYGVLYIVSQEIWVSMSDLTCAYVKQNIFSLVRRRTNYLINDTINF